MRRCVKCGKVIAERELWVDDNALSGEPIGVHCYSCYIRYRDGERSPFEMIAGPIVIAAVVIITILTLLVNM